MKDFLKNYVQHYREDKLALAFVIVAGLAALLGAMYFPKMSPVILVILYISSDPFVYYFRTYRKHLELNEVISRTPQKPTCSHEPYTHRADGTEVLGTKRCKHCGLNEAYWRLA